MAPVALPVARPDNLSAELRAQWDLYAPLATIEGTLTPTTRGAFLELLETIVHRHTMLAEIQAAGWSIVDAEGNTRKHPLASEVRALLQRIETARKNFRLAPFGKSLAPAVEEVDQFEEFARFELISGGKR